MFYYGSPPNQRIDEYFLMFSAHYILSAKGKLCSENDDIAVNNFIHCLEAAGTLKKSAYIKTDNKDNSLYPEDDAEYPKGCNFRNDIYFNQHSTGSSNNNARQICYADD